MKKGISLIVLVITIIVMIILAASVVITLSNTGIITQANKSAFVSSIKEIMQDYSIYQAMYLADENTLSDLNANSENIREIIGSIPKNSIYEEKLEIINGTLIYMVDVKNKADVERATWACEVGLKVNGMNNCTDIEYVETHIPAFEKVGGIYYNTPDLTGFNPEKTFFVTYDEDGNEIIGNNIEKKAPEDWFDYENKEWANIVTINGNLKAYFVWIPRYVYKVDKTNTIIDVKFVDNNNVYIHTDGTKMTYNDITPTFDDNENQTNYVVSSAFYINMGTEEKPEIRQLSGFWMSKYEVSTDYILAPEIDSLATSILVYRSGVTAPSGYVYEYYLNGELISISSNATGTYTYEGLTPNMSYNIDIVLKSNGIEVGRATRTVKTSGLPTYNNANSPELGALLKEETYYLTWDADGNEIRTAVVDENGNAMAAPSDWYNYESKEWANVVVVNEKIGSETYLVWIPRYEYKVLAASSVASEKGIDIAFVPTTQLESTPGYILHPSFDINMGTEENPNIKHLPGFWMTKYELQDVQ